MTVSPADRVVLRFAAEGAGFVGDDEMSPHQIRTAKSLVDRNLFKRAGKKPDGSTVYLITDLGHKAFGEHK